MSQPLPFYRTRSLTSLSYLLQLSPSRFPVSSQIPTKLSTLTQDQLLTFCVSELAFT